MCRAWFGWPVADQWHHNCVLSIITSVLRPYIPQIYICRFPQPKSYGTLSLHNSSNHSSDLVLLHKDNQATVIELTCLTNTKLPWQKHAPEAEQRGFYSQTWLTKDCQLTMKLEIGSLVHYQKGLLFTFNVWPPQTSNTRTPRLLCQIAISCPYHIFLARNFPSLSSPSILTFQTSFLWTCNIVYIPRYYCFLFPCKGFLPCLTSLCTFTALELYEGVWELVSSVSWWIHGYSEMRATYAETCSLYILPVQ